MLGGSIVLLLAWTVAAFSFQIHSVALRSIMIMMAVAMAIGIGTLGHRNLRNGLWSLLAALATVTAWWFLIEPKGDLQWASDVAYNVTAEIGEDEVLVRNIRDFDWHSTDKATPRWKNGVYSPEKITSVDLFTSVWGSPAIAHILVSFGFADGRHLVFSAETRKEAAEAYSSVGGFFKKFELVLVAAEERDILKLRTNYRQEQVSIFPLRLSHDQAKHLFISYLERGNALDRHPEFYNTLVSNCSTIVFQLARLVDPGIPFDWRIVASGYLPSYLHDLGAIQTEAPLKEVLENAVITERAQALPEGANYSKGIRN